MLIHSASQLLTLTGGPQRGKRLGSLGIVEGGAVLVQDGVIALVGSSEDLRRSYPHEEMLDANGQVVLPGFIDAHTHLVWAEDRAAEFELRLQGKSYQEIQAAGGGILSTVRATRAASFHALIAQTRQRAQSLLRHGTTTAEAKSGYGLDETSELAQLEVLLALDQEGPLEIHPTYLAAHMVAPEYQDQPDRYVDLLSGRMLPDLRTWWEQRAPGKSLPWVDVFCEEGAFDLDQTRRILVAAQKLGFPIKVHADEFAALGGSSLGAMLGATSVDHLVCTRTEDMATLASSDTVCVSLPCTPFGLGQVEYTPARQLIEAGCLLAIASDINPGTGWCESMQFVIALACRYLHLTPAEAIAAATINAAAAINQAGRIGSLDRGKQADLLVLSAADYRHLGYRFGTNLVNKVIKRGQLVWEGC